MNTQELAAFAASKETPFYLYELGTIGRQFQILREALPKTCNIYYSMKANPHKEVVMELVRLGANIDISSHQEMLRTISWGVHPSKLSLVGPGKTEALLLGAVQAQIGVIVVESHSEMLRLDRIAQAEGRRMSVKLRINPKLWIDQAGRARKSQSSQFGIDETQLSATIDRLLNLNSLEWIGIHCHVQSSFLSAEYLLNNFRSVISMGKELADRYPGKIQGITIGGGLGIAMFSDQENLKISELSKGLHELLPKMDLNYSIESGRFLVGAAGHFVSRIIEVKESYGKNIIIIDGGMSNHMAAAGFGSLLRKNFLISLLPSQIVKTAAGTERRTYSIAGPSCYSMDVLGSDIELPIAEEGDFICIHNSGAYGLTFSPNEFLGLPKAKEYFL